MRLLAEEKDAIAAAIAKYDKNASVFLFGSRADETKRGGDIDILIISDILDRHTLFFIEEDIFKKIEEQKIDFVLTRSDLSNRFAKMILKQGALKL
jgi:predicted nucleotidyltransferase